MLEDRVCLRVGSHRRTRCLILMDFSAPCSNWSHSVFFPICIANLKKKILNSFCASLLSVFKISLPFQSSGSCALSLILAWQMSSRGFLLERQPARYLKRPDCFQKKSTDGRGWQRLVKRCGAHCTHRHGSFGDDRFNHASFHSGGFILCSEVQRTEFLNLPDTCQSANH